MRKTWEKMNERIRRTIVSLSVKIIDNDNWRTTREESSNNVACSTYTHSVVEAINVYTLSSSQVKELAAALS